MWNIYLRFYTLNREPTIGEIMDISSILDQIKYCDKIVKYKFHFKIVGSVEITCTVPLSIRMKAGLY